MTNFNELKKGDVLSESQYYTVEKSVGDKVQLKNDLGESIVVDNKYVENFLASANQYNHVESINKTKLAELFIQNSRVVMTVNFNKQLKPEDVAGDITNLYDRMTFGMTKEMFGKEVKSALKLKGEERTMVGRHYGGMDVNGRIHFIDMGVERDQTKSYDNRQRLVDPRTLNYVIVNNVKYKLK